MSSPRPSPSPKLTDEGAPGPVHTPTGKATTSQDAIQTPIGTHQGYLHPQGSYERPDFLPQQESSSTSSPPRLRRPFRPQYQNVVSSTYSKVPTPPSSSHRDNNLLLDTPPPHSRHPMRPQMYTRQLTDYGIPHSPPVNGPMPAVDLISAFQPYSEAATIPARGPSYGRRRYSVGTSAIPPMITARGGNKRTSSHSFSRSNVTERAVFNHSPEHNLGEADIIANDAFASGISLTMAQTAVVDVDLQNGRDPYQDLSTLLENVGGMLSSLTLNIPHLQLLCDRYRSMQEKILEYSALVEINQQQEESITSKEKLVESLKEKMDQMSTMNAAEGNRLRNKIGQLEAEIRHQRNIITTKGKEKEELMAQFEQDRAILSDEYEKWKLGSDAELEQHKKALSEEHGSKIRDLEEAFQEQIKQFQEENRDEIEGLKGAFAIEKHRLQEMHNNQKGEMETVQVTVLSKLQEEHEATISAIKRAATQEKQEMEDTHAAELKDLKITLGNRTNEAEASHKFKVEELTDGFVSRLNNLEESHATKLASLEQAHAAAMSELRKSHATTIQMMEDAHASEKVTLEDRHVSEKKIMEEGHANKLADEAREAAWIIAENEQKEKLFDYEKQRLEAEKQSLEEQKEMLQSENRNLIEEVERIRQELELEKGRLEAEILGLEETRKDQELENERLNTLIKNLGDIDEIKDMKTRGDSFYIERFSKLANEIIEISREFKDLPSSPPSHIIAQIPPNLPNFLGDTDASRFIRQAYIQHIISKNLCSGIFQPFLFTLDKKEEKADAVFRALSRRLREKSIRKEAIWRNWTLYTAYSAPNGKRLAQIAAASVVEDIVNTVKYFADPGKVKNIVPKVSKLVKSAVETWRYARIEKEVVIARLYHESDDAEWGRHSYGRFPPYNGDSDIAHSLRSKATGRRTMLLHLLPIVYREGTVPLSTDPSVTLDDGCLFSAGVALYSDCLPVLHRKQEIQKPMLGLGIEIGHEVHQKRLVDEADAPVAAHRATTAEWPRLETVSTESLRDTVETNYDDPEDRAAWIARHNARFEANAAEAQRAAEALEMEAHAESPERFAEDIETEKSEFEAGGKSGNEVTEMESLENDRKGADEDIEEIVTPIADVAAFEDRDKEENEALDVENKASNNDTTDYATEPEQIQEIFNDGEQFAPMWEADNGRHIGPGAVIQKEEDAAMEQTITHRYAPEAITTETEGEVEAMPENYSATGSSASINRSPLHFNTTKMTTPEDFDSKSVNGGVSVSNRNSPNLSGIGDCESYIDPHENFEEAELEEMEEIVFLGGKKTPSETNSERGEARLSLDAMRAELLWNERHNCAYQRDNLELGEGSDGYKVALTNNRVASSEGNKGEESRNGDFNGDLAEGNKRLGLPTEIVLDSPEQSSFAPLQKSIRPSKIPVKTERAITSPATMSTRSVSVSGIGASSELAETGERVRRKSRFEEQKLTGHRRGASLDGNFINNDDEKRMNGWWNWS